MFGWAIWNMIDPYGWWFWIIIALDGFAMLTCAKDEDTLGWLFFWLLAPFGVFGAFGTFNPVEWILDDPVRFLICLGTYLTVGFIWSLVKWKINIGNVAETYREAKEGWQGDKHLREGSLAKWDAHCKDMHIGPYDRRLKVSIMSNKLTYWTVFWPLSVWWFLFTDAWDGIVKIWIAMFGRIYGWISLSTMKNINKDFESGKTDSI